MARSKPRRWWHRTGMRGIKPQGSSLGALYKALFKHGCIKDHSVRINYSANCNSEQLGYAGTHNVPADVNSEGIGRLRRSMGAIKLQWERKYCRGCYVLSASHLLTRNTWVIVGAQGMELHTYWSAAYKFHKLNKVLCILHFFADWSFSEGLCFMLIPPSKLCSTTLSSLGVYILTRGFLPHTQPHYFKILACSPCGPSGNLTIYLFLIMGSIHLPLLTETPSLSI